MPLDVNHDGAAPQDLHRHRAASSATSWSRRFQHQRLAAVLVGLNGVVMLMALCVGCLAAWHAVGERQQMDKTALSDTARALSLAVDREIDRYKGIAETLAASDALDGPTPDLTRFETQARRIGATLGAPILLLDAASMQQLVNTSLPLEARAGAVTASPFQKVVQTGRTFVSDLVNGAVTHRPVIGVAAPVSRGDRMPFIVVLHLEPEALHRLLAAQDLLQGAFAGLNDSQGAVIARSDTLHARLVGRKIPEENLRHFHDNESGIFQGLALDGLEHMIAFHAIIGAPGWAVVVTQPLHVFEAGWRSVMRRIVYGGLCVLLLGGSVALLAERSILVPLRRLTDYVQAIATGSAGACSSAASIPLIAIAELETLRQSFIRAEAAVLAREAELQALFRASPVGIVRAGPDGRIQVANDAFLSIAGWTRSDLDAGRIRLDDLVALGSRTNQDTGARTPGPVSGCGSLEANYARPDGAVVPVLLSFARLQQPEGEWACFVVDLSDVRHTRAMLAENETRLQLAMDAADLGTWCWDVASGTPSLQWDQRCKALFGLPPDAPLDETAWTAAILEEDRAAARQGMMQALDPVQSDDAWIWTFRIRHSDGTIRRLTANGRAFFEPAPLAPCGRRAVRILGTIRDVTAQHEAATALADSEVTFRALATATQEGIAIHDGHCITEANDAFVRMFGFTSYEDAIGSPAIEINAPEVRADVLARVATGDTTRYETIGLRRDGSTFPMEVHGQTISYRGRKMRVGIIRDLTRWKAAEAVLRENESQLRNLLTTLDLGTFITHDANGIIQHWSAGCERLYGWMAHEAVGRDAHGLLQTLFPGSRAEMDASLRAFGEWTGELRQRTKQGHEVVVAARKVMRPAAGGQPAAIMASVTDITAQRHAEAGLRKTEAEFQALIFATADIVYRTSPDWTEMRIPVGQDLVAVTCFSDPLWLQRYIHPDDQPQVMAAIQASIRTGSVFDQEHRIIQADGSVGWTHSRAVPLLDESGQIREWLGAATDITQRKTAEAALAASEALLRLTQQAGEIGGFVLDLDSGTAVLTEQERAIFGLQGTDVQATADLWFRLLHPADRDRVRADRDAAIHSDAATWHSEYRIIRPDGGLRHIEARARFERDSTGRALRMFGIHLDATERKRVEGELRRLNEELEARVGEEIAAREAAQARLVHAQRMEALGQLAGGIAHDFNNVLQAVRGATSLIERHPADAGGVERLARMVSEAADRGASITQRLLTFSRRGKLCAEAVDPVSLLTSMQEILSHTLGAGITVRLDLADALPPLLADKGQLETILINLATNARDAMEGQGRLTFTAVAEMRLPYQAGDPGGLEPGSYIQIMVTDTGCGMPPEVLAKVTEPFFTTKPQGRGTGLGLAMTRGFAEQSGGGLHIESVVNQGTTVRLWLPVADSETGTTAAGNDNAMPAARSNGRLLLVDDDPLVRTITAEGLSASGYTVMSAPDGAAALALLDQGEPVDLIVSDFSMPGMDGITTIEEAQRRRRGLPAILLTGFTKDITETALNHGLGTCSLVRKPIEISELAEQVAVLLDEGPSLSHTA